jgi:hypothetical protein
MVASRLVPLEHAIPAQTDHLDDLGGVIGLAKMKSGAVTVNGSFGLAQKSDHQRPTRPTK